MNKPSFDQVDFGEEPAACEQGYIYAPYIPMFTSPTLSQAEADSHPEELARAAELLRALRGAPDE